MMDANEFIKIEAQAKEDLKIPNNIEACMDWQMFDLPNIQYEWAQRWAKQKFVVESLKDDVDSYVGNLTKSFKTGQPGPNGQKNQYLWATAKEIEAAVDCDPTYCSKIHILKQQQYFLDAIEEYYKNICRLDYKIHDYLDYYKTKTKSF